MRSFLLVALGAVTFLAGAASAQEGQLRDLSVVQSDVAQSGVPRPGSLKISVATDRRDAIYGIGESVRLIVSANEEAYVTVLNIGPNGQTFQLFPNQYQTDNHLLPNRPVEIAGEGSGARIVVSGPVGTELIKVVASSRPLPFVKAADLKARGAFSSVEGGARTVMRDLQVVGDEATQSGTNLAMLNFTLHTVAGRP